MDKMFTEAALAGMYLLQEAQQPLTLTQINDILFVTSDISYMDLAVGFDSMLQKNLIAIEKTPAGEFYSITIEGRITLNRLIYLIRGTVRKRISAYVSEHKDSFTLDALVSTQVSKLESDAYQLVLRAYDKDMDMTELVLRTKDSIQARVIEANWKERADDIIAVLYKELIKDKK